MLRAMDGSLSGRLVMRSAVISLLLSGCSKAHPEQSSGASSSAVPPPLTDRELAVNAARRMVLGHLLSPATARFHPVRVLAEDGNLFALHLPVDAQNAFGALLRAHYCVALKVQNGVIYCSDQSALRECSPSPSETEIALFKGINIWTSSQKMPDVDICKAFYKAPEQ